MNFRTTKKNSSYNDGAVDDNVNGSPSITTVSNNSIPKNEPIVKNSLKESAGDAQTKSDNFKQWFGDWENDPENASKVVNDDGTPKIVYHGTSNGGFNSFDTYGSNFGLFGNGSYFTESENVAKSYTNKGKGNNKQVYSVYLDIKIQAL